MWISQSLCQSTTLKRSCNCGKFAAATRTDLRIRGRFPHKKRGHSPTPWLTHGMYHRGPTTAVYTETMFPQTRVEKKKNKGELRGKRLRGLTRREYPLSSKQSLSTSRSLNQSPRKSNTPVLVTQHPDTEQRNQKKRIVRDIRKSS